MIGKTGDVYRYAYLWHREMTAGEESGRKVRPTFMVVARKTAPNHALMFPLTSQPPLAKAGWIVVPQTEARRAGLDHPTWLMIDEYNLADLTVLYDFADLKPMGAFSTAFSGHVLDAFQDYAASARVRRVRRT